MFPERQVIGGYQVASCLIEWNQQHSSQVLRVIGIDDQPLEANFRLNVPAFFVRGYHEVIIEHSTAAQRTNVSFGE